MDLSAHQREWLDSAHDEINKRDERIRQLEALNATLAAQIDRTQPVVDAARVVADIGIGGWVNLHGEVQRYDAQMTELAKGDERGPS